MTWLHILICYCFNPIVIAICVYLPAKQALQRNQSRPFEGELILCSLGLLLYSLWLMINAIITWSFGKSFSLSAFMGVEYSGMFYFPYTFGAILLTYRILIKDALHTKPALMNFFDNVMLAGLVISAYILMNYYMAWIHGTFFSTQ